MLFVRWRNVRWTKPGPKRTFAMRIAVAQPLRLRCRHSCRHDFARAMRPDESGRGTLRVFSLMTSFTHGLRRSFTPEDQVSWPFQEGQDGLGSKGRERTANGICHPWQ